MITAGTALYVKAVTIRMKMHCAENAGSVKTAEAVFAILVVFAQSAMRAKTICTVPSVRIVTVRWTSVRMKRIITARNVV